PLFQRSRQAKKVVDLEQVLAGEAVGFKHHWWIECPATSSAASIIASDSVGCAWMVLAIDSLVASSSRAAQASAISSVAFGPTMWTPRSSSYFLEETYFTSPPASPRILAFELAVKGNLPILTS